VPPLYEKQGLLADLAEAVKKAVSIPSQPSPNQESGDGDDLLEQGKADIICMAGL